MLRKSYHSSDGISTEPFIERVTFDGNNETDGIQISNDEDYTIKSCTLLIPATQKAVICPTSKSDIRIFECTFTSQVLENVTSFASETALLSSSNKCI